MQIRARQSNGIIKEKPGLTLDVTADFEDDRFETLKQVPHGILTYTYFPLRKYVLLNVAERTTSIWRSRSEGEVCTKASVSHKDGPRFVHLIVIAHNGAETAMYFIKDKKLWKQVSVNTFFACFDRLALSKSVLDYVTLNVNSQFNMTHFSVNPASDNPYAIIVPCPGYVLSRVFDGINTIWKTRNYEDHCTYVNIFYVKKKPFLINLAVSKGRKEERLYFRKVTLAWNQITRAEYIQCLGQAGLNIAHFNNNITFDFKNPDRKRFTLHRTYNMDVLSEVFTPLPGYSLIRVVDSARTVWESNGQDQCIYMRFYSRDKIPYLCHLLVTDSRHRKVLYYIKSAERWMPADKKTYNFVLTHKDDPIYTHRGLDEDEGGARKLVMSHFRNKQGLLIRTYRCAVESPKGNVILIHGSWGHFKSHFCNYNMDWHYETFGYPILPYMKHFTNVTMDSFYKNLHFDDKTCEIYKDVFGWSKLDGNDAFELSPRFQYTGSFLESLNNMGYNVYGMDLQSHGLSDSVSDLRFYINDFKDYVNDVLQFVDIVKRGNFESTTEVWNEDFVYSVSADNIDLKCYLSGFSLGGNIAIQAVQEFYKNAKPGVKFVDGVFILSGMLNIDNNLDTFAKKFTIAVIKFISLMTPRSQNPLENKIGFSESFESFSRYKDPTHYSDRLFYKTVEMLFGACKEVFKNIKYYPDKLPTLFIHVSDDPLCDVNGQRNVVYNHLKHKSDVKLVELEGNSHGIILSHFFPNVMPVINEWFLAHSSKSSIIFK